MNLRKQLAAGLIIALAALLLTACGGSGVDNTIVAQRYLENLESGNLDDAAALACEERANSIASAVITEEEMANFSFENLSCSQRGDEVACNFTVRQNPPDEENASETVREPYDRSVVFTFQDGLVCGFEEEVAE